MDKLYEVEIIRTAKPMGKTQEDWQTFDSEVKRFNLFSEMINFLNDQYSEVKTKRPIYIDGKDGHSQRVGTIYCFKSEDRSHYPVSKWYQQDWVSVNKVQFKAQPIIV